MSEHLIGIDVGTYSAKGVLTTPAGVVLATRTVEYDLIIPAPGLAEHDADAQWWAAVCDIARGLILDSGVPGNSVRAVGCSAIGPTMLPVDASGAPLRNAILYGIDTRSWREAQDLEERYGAEALLARTGKRPSVQSAGPKILWLKRNEPEIYARAAHFLTASSYLAYRLTGAYVVDEYSAAAFDPLYDVPDRAWSEERLDGVCSIDQLAEVVDAHQVVGTVTDRAAQETGLTAGTPVVAGTIDAASEALSVGVTAPGDTMLMYGTTLFVISVTDGWKRHPALWSAPYVGPNLSCMAAGLATSAALTRWFRDGFGQDLLDVERQGGDNAYQALAREAADVPAGANGLIALPYFSGERTPLNDPKARGVIAGLTLSHGRGHLFRALLEGVGFALRHNLDTMREAGANPSRLVAVGGGTKNDLWLQIVSDVLNLPQEVPATTVGASYGDAYLAGMGVGLFDDFHTLRDAWVRPDRVVEPNPAAVPTYRQAYPTFRATYDNLKEQLHELAERQV